MSLASFSRSYFFEDLVIPCLTNYAYGVWLPSKLEWHSEYIVNHYGTYGDMAGLNLQRGLGIGRLMRDEVLNGLTAIIVDQAVPNYYHILAYIIPDLIKMRSEFYIENAAVSESNKIITEYLGLLEMNIVLISLRHEALPIRNSIIPETYSPQDSRYDRCAALISVKEMIEKKLVIKDDSYPNKIYIERKISKNGSNLRAVFPQEVLHGDLIANGWHIVYLEDIPILDQIKFFANAKQIAGVHGAALTNILYTPVDASIIEITHANGSPDCFLKLSEALDMGNYLQISCQGLFGETQEKEIKIKTGNYSNNALPLLYTEELKDALLGGC